MPGPESFGAAFLRALGGGRRPARVGTMDATFDSQLGQALAGRRSTSVLTPRPERRRRNAGVLATALVVCLGAVGATLLSPGSGPVDPRFTCTKGRMVIGVNVTFEQVMLELKSAYENACPDADLTLNVLGDNTPRENIDVSIVQSPPNSSAPPIAVIPYALVSNPTNGVQNLTIAQIKDVFQGKVADWRDLGGTSLPIHPIVRSAASGSRNALETRLLDGLQSSSDCGASAGGPCQVASDEEAVNAVWQTPGAIGYARRDLADNVALTIDGHTASDDAIRAGEYRFVGVVGYFANSREPGGLQASFLEFLRGRTAADRLRKGGFLPCSAQIPACR